MNIRDLWKGLLGKKQADAVAVFGGAGVLTPEEQEALSLWKDLYEGRAPWAFGRVKSLALPSAIASEIARMATIEMKSKVTGGKRAEFLDKCYQALIADIRRQVEYGCAMSGLVFKPYVKDGAIRISCLLPDSFYPTACDSAGNVTGAVFVDCIEQDGKVYRRLEHHRMGDVYLVENRAFVSPDKNSLGREIALSEVPQWSDIEERVELSGVRAPLFGYFRYPGANFLEPGSPLGVSCFAKAVDLIHQADKQYSRNLKAASGRFTYPSPPSVGTSPGRRCCPMNACTGPWMWTPVRGICSATGHLPCGMRASSAV